ncbi:MAG: hypothetical protein ACPGC9_00160 [Cytophagales bacterium]
MEIKRHKNKIKSIALIMMFVVSLFLNTASAEEPQAAPQTENASTQGKDEKKAEEKNKAEDENKAEDTTKDGWFSSWSSWESIILMILIAAALLGAAYYFFFREKEVDATAGN